MTRHIIIGDVHGCRAELEALLAVVDPRPEDTVVFTGDLVDRGPDSPGCVRVIRKLADRTNVVLVMGNHEEKAERFRKHLARFREDGKRIPIDDRRGKRAAIADALSPEDVAFLEGAVLFHRIPEHHTVVVHGGVTPRMETLPPDGTRYSDLKGKDKKRYSPIVRTRFVDIDGKQVSLAKTDTDIHFHWTEAYDGRFGRVVYGHEPYTGSKAPVEGYLGMSVGIDLGCVFGGRLAALILHEDGEEEVESVVAFKKYATRTKRPGYRLKKAA